MTDDQFITRCLWLIADNVGENAERARKLAGQREDDFKTWNEIVNDAFDDVQEDPHACSVAFPCHHCQRCDSDAAEYAAQVEKDRKLYCGDCTTPNDCKFGVCAKRKAPVRRIVNLDTINTALTDFQGIFDHLKDKSS